MMRKLSKPPDLRERHVPIAAVAAVGTVGDYAVKLSGPPHRRRRGQVRRRRQQQTGSGDIQDNPVNTFDVHSFLGADVVDESLTMPNGMARSTGLR